MNPRPAPSALLRPLGRCLVLLMLLCLGLAAGAQQDPPTLAARLSAQQGTASFSAAGDDSWYDAVPNRPLASGDRLWTDRGTRAEIHIGSAAVRLDEQTLLELSELGDQAVRLTLQQGTLQLRVRDDMAGERIEVDTDNLALVVQSPGQYRVGADPAGGTTQVAVDAGSAIVYGDNGASQPLAARQQLAVAGRELQAAVSAPLAGGEFDRWVAERNRVEDQSVAARYVSRGVVGYQQLDAWGDWQSDPAYGAVWFPREVAADWAPYSEGGWIDVAPWGWTWVDSAPWGFAPSHYGRWARIGPRWGWVPGPRDARPVYAPALVGFVGGAAAQAALALGGGRQGIGWFPLAPGEAWRPSYRASPRYIEQANRMALHNRAVALDNNFYINQRRPEAVTVVPSDAFGRRAFGRRDTVRLPVETLASLPVAAAPALPRPSHFAPGIGSTAAFGFLGRPATALPPMPWRARQPLPSDPQQAFGQAPRLPQAQQELSSRAAQTVQQQQFLQQRAMQAQQQAMQAQALRQQQEALQRAAQQQQAQTQAQQQLQLQAQRQQETQQQLQQQAALAQQQQLLRLQEAQQRTAQQQQQLQALHQMQEAQQRAQLQQQMQMQMQQAAQLQQQRAMQAQMLQAQQAQQAQQLNALRQAQQAAQARAAAQMQMQAPRMPGSPGGRPP